LHLTTAAQVTVPLGLLDQCLILQAERKHTVTCAAENKCIGAPRGMFHIACVRKGYPTHPLPTADGLSWNCPKCPIVIEAENEQGQNKSRSTHSKKVSAAPARAPSTDLDSREQESAKKRGSRSVSSSVTSSKRGRREASDVDEIFCFCQKPYSEDDGTMHQCLGVDSKGNGWYHEACLRSRNLTVPKKEEDWKCVSCTASAFFL